MRRALLSLSLLLSLAIFGQAAQTPEEISFRVANGFILLQAKVEGHSEALTLLLDSGASATVFDLRTAKRCGFELGPRENVRGVGSQAAAFRLRPMAVQAGGRTLDHAVLAVDLANAEPLCGEHVDGLIGAGFFMQHLVELDYGAKKLRFPASAPEEKAVATHLPLKRYNGILCAQVSVNGSRPRWTRLDTGCNDSLHWVVPRRTEKARKETTIGFIDEEQDVTQAKVKLGNHELTDIETSLHGRALFPGEAGLLGNGLLSRYVVTIDGPGQHLYLR